MTISTEDRMRAFILIPLVVLPTSVKGREDASTAISYPRCVNEIHKVQSDIENRIGGTVSDVTYPIPRAKKPIAPTKRATPE